MESVAEKESGEGILVPQRNRFFRGKRMRAEEFSIEQSYLLHQRRLINRSVLGWGVTSGYRVWPRCKDEDGPTEQSKQGDPHQKQPGAANQTAHEKLCVGRGFALDAHGRELLLPKNVYLTPKNTFLTDGKRPLEIGQLERGSYLLRVHYAEKGTEEIDPGGSCGCDGHEYNFLEETVVFSLEKIDCCSCSESGREPCQCHPSSSCDRCGSRQACLCQWVSKTRDQGAGRLYPWQDWNVGFGAGVPLACVEVSVEKTPCDVELRGCVRDDCGPRKLIKGNDLLYDLIRGQDLVRIKHVSWAEKFGQEPIQWDDFVSLFNGSSDSPKQTTAFTVEFSGPVQSKSLRPEAVVMTALVTDASTGWRDARRVPIVDLEPGGSGSGDTTTSMTVVVSSRWVRDELGSGPSWLSCRFFNLEIEVRGDLLIDCHGQSVDADARGLTGVPSGNGTPGGTLLMAYRVCGRPHKHDEEHGE